MEKEPASQSQSSREAITFEFQAGYVRYDNLRAFEKHLEGAAPLQFSPLYCIFGQEAFECQEAVDLLLRKLLPDPGQRELSLIQLDGSHSDEQELGNALHSFSFFSKTQVIWIRQADKLKKSAQDNLLNYFSRPTLSQYLLLSAAGWQKSTSFYKAAEKAGVVLDFAELKPWEKEQRLAEWVNKQAAVHRKLIAYPVCQFLVKRIGCDQALLAQEIEKLICFTGEKKEITQKDVEILCHNQQIDTIWQLGEALFRKDAASALNIVRSFLLEGQPLIPLLRQIRSQFQTEFQICLLLAQGKQAQDISQEFPYLKGQVLERHLRQARQYGGDAFKKGLLALDEAELRAKNSSIDENIIVELLIMRLTYG
jgi:DNA polymerase-3 subunit delta